MILHQIGGDAGLTSAASAAKQLADIEGMITRGCSALIILAQDSASIGPALDAAADAGIPVVGYDRMIDDPRAFYLTFNNVEVGRMQAREVLKAMPKVRYVMMKGSPVDPNADFLRGGQQEVLQAAIDAGDITIVGEAYTDDWQPANAQKNMEQILTETDNGVDAVVASNDGTAGGVVAALTAQGMAGIPVSGQDGDMAALNRVALGTQTVSVWKDSRALGKAAGEIAVALASGTAMDAIAGAAKFTAPGGKELNAVLLAPQPITKENLNLKLDVRLLGMLMAVAVAVAVVFTIWTGGTFVGPRNVFNIAVQTVPVAIMACGMVFVIVARHIDLPSARCWRCVRRSWR